MHDLSQQQIAHLKHAAKAATRQAYAPYSNFNVGAAVLLQTGEIVAGCNVENASYRLTCCAEQAAITRAVAEHGPKIRVAAVAVANADETVACMPCGACRQNILEFAQEDCIVFYPGEDGIATQSTLEDLLPASFRFQR